MKLLLAWVLLESVALAADGASSTPSTEQSLGCAVIGAIAGAAAAVRWPALQSKKEGPFGMMFFGGVVGFMVPGVIALLVLVGMVWVFMLAGPDITKVVDAAWDQFTSSKPSALVHEELRIKQQAAQALIDLAANEKRRRKRKRRRKSDTPKLLGPSDDENLRRQEAAIEQARRDAAKHGYSQEALNEQLEWIRRTFQRKDFP